MTHSAVDGPTTYQEQQILALKPVFESLTAMETIAAEHGWQKSNVGESANIDYNHRFDLYIRRRNLGTLISGNGDIKKISPTTESENPTVSSTFDMVSNTTLGFPKAGLTPSHNLPTLSDFGAYPSLVAARPNKPALIISFDSEWFYVCWDGQQKREVLSWQFAVIDGSDLVEYVFLRKHSKYNLHLELAIGRILDDLHMPSVDIRKILRYTSLGELDQATGRPVEHTFSTAKEALDNCKVMYPDGQKYHRIYEWSMISHIPVVLVCHAGKVDLSTLDQSKAYRKDILHLCSEVQGGLITLQTTLLRPDSLRPEYAHSRHVHKYPINFGIADTMCHAPAGSKSLETLGKTIGWKKVEVSEEVKGHMDQFIIANPGGYLEYSATDSTVTLLYSSALYGYNQKLPVTITSATAKVIKEIMMEYLDCHSTKEFDRVYRGLETIKHGLKPREDRPGYIESQSKEPISRNASLIQSDASHAFHGGYNSCSDVGYFPFETTDYDLQNAYPTAMCLIADVDWENPIKYTLHNEELTLQSFSVGLGGINPVPMMFAYVQFEFPKDVTYPCIPVNIDGIPVFPRTSDGLDGVYACGPELYLAVCLGAKVYVRDGYVLNTLLHEREESYSLRQAVYQMVKDRKQAKADHGKGALEELILKTMVNSGYGKNAQNVIQKSTWTAYNEEMEDLGCSSITNPVSAAMITSIVRAELLAAQNQIHELGYICCSVTTDGFISNCPEDTLKALDLYGIRKVMEAARLFLTDGADPEIWEAKHRQDDLINFTTRGNVSLYCKDRPYWYDGKQYEGVCAHNSSKSGYAPDSYQDRLWLMEQVLSRIGSVDYTDQRWTKFRALVQGKDFEVTTVTTHISMDYDLKRKPDRNSFHTEYVTIDNTTYEIANFSTVPFEDVAEFRKYRAKKKLCTVLRTVDDWKLFWDKVDLDAGGQRVRDMEWAILNSCIMGHRCHRWIIPKLDELTGQARCDWINKHNTSSKQFKPNDWKNAGRPARQVNMLPDMLLQEKLDELMMDC